MEKLSPKIKISLSVINFNSYRFSYIYALRGFGKDQINVGFTAKVRDAETRFSQPGIVSSYDNIGFCAVVLF